MGEATEKRYKCAGGAQLAYQIHLRRRWAVMTEITEIKCDLVVNLHLTIALQ